MPVGRLVLSSGCMIVALAACAPAPLNITKFDVDKAFTQGNYRRAVQMSEAISKNAHARYGAWLALRHDLLFAASVMRVPQSDDKFRAHYYPVAISSVRESKADLERRLANGVNWASSNPASIRRREDESWALLAASDAVEARYEFYVGNPKQGLRLIQSFVSKSTDPRSALRAYCEAALLAAEMFEGAGDFVTMVNLVRLGLKGECVPPFDESLDGVMMIPPYRTAFRLVDAAGLPKERERVEQIQQAARKAPYDPDEAAKYWMSAGFPDIGNSFMHLITYDLRR